MLQDLKPFEASPLKNETTGEYPVLDPKARTTRSTIHRILKAYGVQHHAGASLDQLIALAQAHEVPLNEAIPPGPVPDLSPAKAPDPKPTPQAPAAPEPVKSDAGEYAEDGYPKNHGYLKKMAKERGIRTVNTDKRADIVRKLNEYMESLKNG